jgi:integrase
MPKIRKLVLSPEGQRLARLPGDLREAELKRKIERAGQADAITPKPPLRLGDVATVSKLPRPATGNHIYYDAAVPGFGCRVTAAGHRAFVFNYRTRGGRERRYTIGDAGGGEGGWTVGAARIRARELRRQVDDGGDPLGEIEAEREAPTVADLIDRFQAEHLTRKRAGTAADYKRMIRSHIAPALKNLKVADVTHDDVVRLHDRITKAGHPYRANRVIAVLSKMFSLSIRWGYRETNPCKGIERNYEAKRKRYLSGDELKGLIKALSKHPDQSTADIFRLLLLTGARRGEVLTMCWADLDLTAGTWTKPASVTKQAEEHQVPLSAPARLLLNEIRKRQASGNSRRRPLPEYVFAGRGDAQHVVNIKRAWRSICKAAKISGLRIHDLRHSFASQLVSGGASLPLIGALLGHSNPATTHRYAHLFDDPQRMAVERLGVLISGVGKPVPQEPTPLRRPR